MIVDDPLVLHLRISDNPLGPCLGVFEVWVDQIVDLDVSKIVLILASQGFV
jgi:hypothetical protein